ncbi:sensor histidine kinase [Sinomonas humi]|uniref:histidine kinase n=1 Tax=Sinomonas humi TaxID=1338436 RepID=A0A0B2AFN5_9MICC|nr:histidine kinase [Sinomonas humi]KHL00497.1 histidine kinase [Sinomonas humi]
MRLHHRLYRWAQAHPGRVDALMALGLFLFLSAPYEFAFRPRELVFSALVIAPLAWRRTRPVASGAVVAAACLIEVILGNQPVAAQALALATVFSLAAYAPRWASLGGLIAGLVGGFLFVLRYFVLPMTASAYLSTGEAGVRVPVQLVGGVAIGAVVLVAWTLGDLARARRLAVQALEDRARRLEVEREQERGLAAADERSRIAREMHDIVAHSLSVIIAQADGARYAAAQEPGLAVAALGTIGETGRGSLREMRRLLGVLRSDGAAPTRPLPTLDDLPSLLDAVRRAGLVVGFQGDGAPRGALPAGAELTAYRVVQESLTNVFKHAGPRAAASVVRRWTARGLELDVADDGRGAAADTSGGEGQGLHGMAERVALYDGSVDAGPLPGGGFRVRAFIPYTEA